MRPAIQRGAGLPADRGDGPAAPVRTALMGCGRWGLNWARVLGGLEGFGLVAVADPDPAARERAGRIAPRAVPARDIADVVADVEAVVVCTPSADHAAHAEALLARGKHVLVEKPMALTLADARRMRAAANREGRVLAVGHQLLRHAGYEALTRIVAAGRIGRPVRIRAERTGRIGLAAERGVLWSYGPHDVAMVLALLGRPPSSVRGRPLSVDGTGWPAAIRVELGFEGGPEAELTLDGAASSRVRLFQVVGERGRVSFDDGDAGGRLTLESADAGHEERIVTADEPLVRECLGFCRAIRDGDASGIADGDHGEAVTRVLQDIQADLGAGADGRMPVTSSACP